jgi:branched-chain amino acid transport system permease protein
VGAALAAAFSVVVGLPTFRLRGPYFTIATIGVGEAVRVIASGLEFTGGSSGLRMPPGTFDFNANYYAMVGLALLTLALVAWLQQHAFGLALEAIRQDIDAAEALGVHSTQAKLAAHAISAALVAIAGGVFATNFQYISPGSVFDFRLSLTIVLMPIVGGMATITGPVLGALLFSYLQIKLLASPTLRDSYLFIYGGLLIVVMLFEPKGIVGLWERLIGLRPRRRAQPPVGRPAVPAENGPILVVSSVSKRFGGLLALDSVSFEVQRGEIFSVIGPNGAGKTTLFSCLVGTYPPTSGSVRFRGEELKGLRNDQVVARGLVRTHQIVKPFRDMTVADNIRWACSTGGCDCGARRRASGWTRCSADAAGPPGTGQAGVLSIGELKRLEIARALATGPEVLCLDEVMGG